MNKQQAATFARLVNSAADYMVKADVYAEKSIWGFKAQWRKLPELMREQKITDFNSDTAVLLIKACSRCTNEEAMVTAINKLDEFNSTGKLVALKWWRKKRNYVFEGPIGELITDFLEIYSKNGRTPRRVQHVELNIHPFSKFCNENRIETFSEKAIMRFFAETEFPRQSKVTYIIQSLVLFSKHLYDCGITAKDISKHIPRPKVIRQPLNPTVYTEEEIKQILDSMERVSPTGKRNYAMVLLTIRLGIRASDVADLKIGNLDLKKNVICFIQRKTRKEHTLPFLPDIKAAIVDYLKNGRRKSKETYIFLMDYSPFGKMTDGALAHVYNRAIEGSGIELKGRKKGSRPFRSSLATKMLKNGVPLKPIADVLGHFYTNMAKHYMRVDETSLSKIVMEVPLIDENFYTENGFIQ